MHWLMAWYLHIDMDAFYASVEQMLDPGLIGKPVIVGGRNGRGVVTSASYEARKFGVRSAMPGFQAEKLCPQGIFLPNRRGVYSDFSKKVFAILERFSPEVHAISIDEGIVDLTGTEKLFGPPLQTAGLIIKTVKEELGLPSSGGVSTNRTIAKMAATLAKPEGMIFVPQGGEFEFVAPLDVSDIPGIGPKTNAQFLQRGIKTVGDLLRDKELASRYLDLEESTPHAQSHDHSMGSETTLDTPMVAQAALREVLWELVEEVGRRLRKQKLFARCITVKIRYTNFQTITRSQTLGVPTNFDREIFAVASKLLATHLAYGCAVRLLGVTASGLQSSGWQEPLFGRDRRQSLEKLYRGIDRLRQKYGDESIGTANRRKTFS